jgi:SNF2 family DNA or RNA helicase
MEQGTGKTIPALVRLLELLKHKQINDALVVAPKSTLGAWERDIEKFDEVDQQILKESITLVNYDLVWRRDSFKKPWGAIVLDEAHFIKNRSSKRSQALLKLGVNAKYKYILTGTPIGNGQLENIWSQYCFLKPYIERGRVASTIFGGTYPKFSDRYCILNQYHQPYAYRNVNELQEIIHAWSYRVKKIDCLDLPEKLPDEIVEVELIEKKLYKELHQESTLADYEILAENSLSRMIKLRQLSSGFINNDGEILDVKCEKLNILEELITGLDKKLVIFAQFTHSIKSISELLTKLKIKHVVLNGETKDKTIWRQFQTDESIQIIVCQYDTACAGIDLFASDTIIYYEPTLKSNTLEQSRDRIHRTGQKNKCSYIHLITKGTIERDIYRALAGYSDFTEKLFTEYMASYRKKYDATRKGSNK